MPQYASRQVSLEFSKRESDVNWYCGFYCDARFRQIIGRIVGSHDTPSEVINALQLAGWEVVGVTVNPATDRMSEVKVH